MKKLISILSLVFAIGIVSANAQCCNKTTSSCCQSAAKVTCSKTQENTDVQVYYFHGTRRCATCQAVESVSKEAVEDLYSGLVDFTSINREEEKENPLIKKYQISGQTLLVVKGNKVVNLTNDAFMNARTHPDKLKAKIKSTVDELID